MQLLAGGDPALVWNVVTGQFTVVVPDLEVTKAVRAVGEELAVGLQQRWAVSRRTGVVEAIRSKPTPPMTSCPSNRPMSGIWSVTVNNQCTSRMPLLSTE